MKKTIIVPVDFSAASVNAVNYAADFALAINAGINLVHICSLPAVSEFPVGAEAFGNLINDAAEKIEQLKLGLQHKTSGKILIDTEVLQGTIITQLKEYCHNIQPALVIIGTHESTTLERIVFGSTTLSAISHLKYPLLVIPCGTRFTGIHKIGLACDLQQADLAEQVEEITYLFNEFHPQLHILHVSTKKHGMLSKEEIKMTESLRTLLKEENPVFHFIQDENIESSLITFSEKNNLDLLIVIPKKHGLLNSLLSKSYSKEIILTTHVPVMSIHE
ncbi:MAG: universal stress protein [Bacteroidota bacterium]